MVAIWRAIQNNLIVRLPRFLTASGIGHDRALQHLDGRQLVTKLDKSLTQRWMLSARRAEEQLGGLSRWAGLFGRPNRAQF